METGFEKSFSGTRRCRTFGSDCNEKAELNFLITKCASSRIFHASKPPRKNSAFFLDDLNFIIIPVGGAALGLQLKLIVQAVL
jgi:hypothetical protein